MTHRVTEAYAAMFQELKKLIPSLAPTHIMSDFEEAERNACRKAFPEAKILGCYFHYAQVWFQLHNTQAYKKFFELQTRQVDSNVFLVA